MMTTQDSSDNFESIDTTFIVENCSVSDMTSAATHHTWHPSLKPFQYSKLDTQYS